MLDKLDHIGIAVNSIEEIKSFFQQVFNLSPVFEEIVPEQKVKVVGFLIGDSKLEFLEPTSTDSPVAKFLDKKGEGIHHLAVEVKNIDQILKRMKSKHIQLIDEEAKIGVAGKKIAFIHPKSTFGVLLELTEKKLK